MKYKVLFPMLMSGLIFNACSKDNGGIKTPPDAVWASYTPGNALIIDQLAIYTSTGIITDPAFIQGYIGRNVSEEDKSLFNVNQSYVENPGINLPLALLDNNRVEFKGVNMEITLKKDSLMLISEYTTTTTPTYDYSCGELFSKVPAFTPSTNCPDGSCANYRKTYPILVNGSYYYLPILTYVASTKDCSMANSEYPTVNTLNSNLSSLLTAGDSVLVQTARLPLVKKIQ
jgi:hypothetical protein